MKRTNLVDFIKGKLEKGSFPYQEGAWEQAAEQFAAWDAARRRKRRILFLILPFLAVGALLTWQFWPSAIPNTISPSNSSQENTTASLAAFDSISTSSKTIEILNIRQKVKTTLLSNPLTDNTPTASQIGEEEQNPTDATSVVSVSDHQSPSIKIDEITFQNEQALAGSNISPSKYANGKTPFKRLSPYVEAGYTFFKGFATEATPNPVWAGTPLVGTGIIYRLNRNLRMKMGLQYSSRTELNHNLYVQERTYDFVRQNRETQWTPEKLHYLSLPFELQRRTFQQQRLLIGGRLGYMLGTEGNLTSQNSSFYNPNPEPTVEKAPSYVTGISLWDISLHAGYEVRLGTRWGASASYHWGLIDVLKDDIFQVNGMNRNTHFSVKMTYHF